jgi:hypothetical protein
MWWNADPKKHHGKMIVTREPSITAISALARRLHVRSGNPLTYTCGPVHGINTANPDGLGMLSSGPTKFDRRPPALPTPASG